MFLCLALYGLYEKGAWSLLCTLSLLFQNGYFILKRSFVSFERFLVDALDGEIIIGALFARQDDFRKGTPKKERKRLPSSFIHPELHPGRVFLCATTVDVVNANANVNWYRDGKGKER